MRKARPDPRRRRRVWVPRPYALRRLDTRARTTMVGLALPIEVYQAARHIAFLRQWTLAECLRAGIVAWVRRQKDRPR